MLQGLSPLHSELFRRVVLERTVFLLDEASGMFYV